MGEFVFTHATPHVTPHITKIVVAAMSEVDDEAALQTEIAHLCHYVQHTIMSREVMLQRKQWDDDHKAKISDVISRAMK